MSKAWRRRGVYLWRCRKPHSWLGLPLIGRHNAYVGETSSRFHRDRQHLHGGGRFGAVQKPWADLDPKCYPLPCLFPGWTWVRRGQEKLYIWLLLPVYNAAWNKANPRRIKPGKAEQQRWRRDRNKLSIDIRVMLARLLVWLTIVSAAAIGGWAAWVN